MMNEIEETPSYLMIIGAMKCGTSSLYINLIRHPDICPCIKKEPEYFTFDTEHESPYENLWQFDPQRHRFVIEASTGYTKFPLRTSVPQRIKSYGIDPHMIYIVRDPFARIESDFNFAMPQKWFDPELAITDERYLCKSDYFLQLEEFRKVFGKEKLLLVDFDEFAASPNEHTNSIFKSLGLSSMQFEKQTEKKNVTRKLTYAERRIYSSRKLNSFFWSMPRIARGALRQALIQLSSPSPKRKLTEDERFVIHKKLAPNMLKFQEDYGFDISKWGFS